MTASSFPYDGKNLEMTIRMHYRECDAEFTRQYALAYGSLRNPR